MSTPSKLLEQLQLAEASYGLFGPEVYTRTGPLESAPP
jgi:hypothetical protein